MLKKIISIFLTAALLISVLPVLASAETTESFKVEVDASTSTVSASPIIHNQGDKITVEIRASQNPGITSLKLYIDYDPTVLEAVVDESVPISTFARIDKNTTAAYRLRHVLNDDISRFVYDFDSWPDTVTNTGTIAVLTFVVKEVCAFETAITATIPGPGYCVNDDVQVKYETESEVFDVHEINQPDGVVTDPDCTNEGYTTYTCEACEEVVVGNITAPLGHTGDIDGDGIDDPQPGEIVEPDCTTPGSIEKIVPCYRCEEVIIDSWFETIPANGHTEGDAVIENNVAPDCVTDGSVDFVKYCTVCKTELNRVTVTHPALGHTPAAPVVEKEVAADCENAGSFDVVTYCRDCGEELSRETKNVSATGHTEKKAIENQKPADCENAGTFDIVTYCTVCDKELDRETVTQQPAIGHNAAAPVQENFKTAGCVTAGSFDLVEYCTLCNEELSRVTIPIPAIGHSAATPVIEKEVAADCENAGSFDIVTYCIDCGEEMSRDTHSVSATGHTEKKEIENKVAADCVTAGSFDLVTYCSVCGKELNRETTPVPATGHNPGQPVVENVVEATCAAKGSYDLVTKCTLCGEVIESKTEETPMIDHVLVHYEAQEATHDQIGWEAYDACENCDYTTYVEIPKLPYKPGDLNGDDEVTDADAIYLLYATFNEDDYPLNQDADFNDDGEVTDADAIYLLYATFDSVNYPLN